MGWCERKIELAIVEILSVLDRGFPCSFFVYVSSTYTCCYNRMTHTVDSNRNVCPLHGERSSRYSMILTPFHASSCYQTKRLHPASPSKCFDLAVPLARLFSASLRRRAPKRQRVACVQSYTNSYEDDVAPESGAIIPAENSPSGKALLVAAYEESNTVAVFEITTD